MTLRNNGISVKKINCNVATTTSSSSSSNSSTSNTTACGNKSNNTNNNYFSNNNFCNENYSDNNFTCSGGNTRSSSSNHHHHYKSTKLNYQPHSQHQQSNNDKNMVNYELESHQQQSQQVNYHSHSQQHGHNNPVLNDMTNLTSDEKKKLEEIRIRRSKLLHEIQKLKEEISNVRKEMNHLDHTSTQNSPMGNNANSNDENSVQRAKQLSIGKKKFNMDPKKGIEFLVDNNLLKNMPEDVAKFLYKGEGLNKTAIGTYLGEKIDFNLNVLDSFIELHDFENLLLVQALRQFLWSFRLPGEAQKIDRMMEKFAARYCQQNPNVFSNTDTCFVLSFSIIMLNTSLHNPNVKDKMTADKFIVMNRGINNGGDLPRELLISLYDNIRQEPFKIPEDDGNDLMHTFFNPDREGWLWKQGGRYKSWKRRWFILNDKCLYYFEYTTDKEPRGIIPLENVDIREISDRGGRQHCFELYSAIGEVIKACKTDTEGRVIEGRHSVYRMSSATAEEKDAWVGGIRASVSYSPFYEMLSARKRKAQHNK